MKKGYKAEYEVKKALFKEFSPNQIFKIAIGGGMDFCILGKEGRITKLIEVKNTKKKKWYPTQHDFRQFKILKKIQSQYNIPVEYWIKIKGQWQIFNLNKVKKFFS